LIIQHLAAYTLFCENADVEDFKSFVYDH